MLEKLNCHVVMNMNSSLEIKYGIQHRIWYGKTKGIPNHVSREKDFHTGDLVPLDSTASKAEMDR